MDTPNPADVRDIGKALAAPFPADVVGFKPQSVTKDGNRALAVAYIDARDVAERLDAVMGPDGWESEMTPLPEGNVLCRLTLHFPGGRSVSRTDVGGESDQPDRGDKVKAAVSDALKRAAVQFGVGRYLYRLPAVWTAYDQKERKVTPPALPAWALPGGSGIPPAAPAPRPAPAASRATAPPKAEPPKDDRPFGVRLAERLAAKEAELVRAKLCRPGELVAHVLNAGLMLGHPAVIAQWSEADGVGRVAAEAVEEFEERAAIRKG